MAADERRVRRLRLAAADAAGVQRGLRLIDDALRCASLGPALNRVVLVRRLALGLLPARASSQSLALRIERAWAGAAPVHGREPSAACADVVWFEDALDAHLCLALRLAGGAAAAEWYWPLAVAGHAATRPPLDALRRTALSLARQETARVAMPAWIAAMAAAGHAGRVVAAIEDGDLAWLRQRAGLPPRGEAPVDGLQPPLGAAASPGASRPAIRRSAERDGLRRGPPDPGRATHTARAAADSPVQQFLDQALAAHRARAGACSPGTAGGTGAPLLAAGLIATGSIAAPRPQRHGRDTGASEEPAPANTVADRTPPLRPAARPTAALAPGPPPAGHGAWRRGEPTRAGGLFFLVSVLQRLGDAGAGGWPPDDASEFVASRVLAQLLARLGVPLDDPAWAVAAFARTAAEPATADRLARLAGDWMKRCRRWLRTQAGIGPATLVLRPARLAIGATHVDVHFGLADLDLRVRRAGLDIDCGWLPWLGRVVAFHYTGRGEGG